MKRFAVGDRVVIVCAPNRPEFLHAITTVVGGPEPYNGQPASGVREGDPVYVLDVPPRPGFGRSVALGGWLEPYLGREEGNEKVAWSEDLLRLVGNGLFPARKEPVR